MRFGLLRWVVFLTMVSPVLSAQDDGYQVPSTLPTTSKTAEVMQKMETAVAPLVLEKFQQAHPAAFWIFGEDRQFAVRKGIIPAHWFADGAAQYQQFSGTAQPGEFYVFQSCLVVLENRPNLECLIELDSLKGAACKTISRPRLETGNNEPAASANHVIPVWLGVQIPLDAQAGTYRGTVSFREFGADDQAKNVGKLCNEKLHFSITVAGAALADAGTNEGWRLSRLTWLDSDVGESDTIVTRPFTPIKTDVSTREFSILGRQLRVGPEGIPSQLTGYFSRSNTKVDPQYRTEAWAAPARLECVIDGKIVNWQPGTFEILRQTPTAVEWRVINQGGGMELSVSGLLEFDGNLQLQMKLSSAGKALAADDVRFILPWNRAATPYIMGLGLRGGNCPEQHDWKWDVTKHQDALWLGDVNLGAMLRFKGKNFQRPLINAYYDFRPLQLPESWGSGGIRMAKDAKITTVTAYAGAIKIPAATDAQGSLFFNIDWYFTPFKPLDTQKHFSDRYYHAGQGAAVENTAALKKDGANILEIHHNRLCNPYINYPYNDDSIQNLTDFIKKAHADDMRVALYYTTRELTQNIPEFAALASMGGEIILPRRKGVSWPVTNPRGPHPWLLEHVGDNIVPAWRENLRFSQYKEKLDLAVITTPDSRWNNFYLEGLDYLVKKVGIDGLYIDDTALDRKSMQRARRILDADGNTERRVSMHSWNHFNGLAKWSNSSIAFMELYPYYDGLWHGEGFSAAESPEYMLIEMSGIPYGLMSEMLDHPQLWHGMVFGMRTRWPWSGDPRKQWALEREFGIEESEMIGWWDPACPIKSNQPDCKISVYRQKGKTFVALASWSKQKISVALDIDWSALGLSPQRAKLWLPPVEGIQEELVYPSDGKISIEPNQGAWIIIDETPRSVKLPAVMVDPSLGKKELATAEAFDLAVPANTTSTRDLAWPSGATLAMARIDPKSDAGQSWGLGMALGWADGKYLQINARTDGRCGLRFNGAEILTGKYQPNQPALIAIRLEKNQWQILMQQGDGDWQLVKDFPRSAFTGEPTTLRYGKIGQSWQPSKFADAGGIQPCRVDWVKLYGTNK